MSEGLVQGRNEESASDLQDCDVLEVVLSKTVNAGDRKGKRLRRKERLQKQEVVMHVGFLVLSQLALCFIVILCFFYSIEKDNAR